MRIITTSTTVPALRLLSTVATVALVSITVSGQRPKFYSDDPIARVEDTRDASSVQPKSVNLTYDETLNLFGNPGDPEHEPPRDEHQHHRRGARLELVYQPISAP